MKFSLMIDAQEVIIHYQPNYFPTLGYGHFEFTSPHTPYRRIPVSDTGYRSHFSPMSEIEQAPSLAEYALQLAYALQRAAKEPDDDCAEESEQMTLF